MNSRLVFGILITTLVIATLTFAYLSRKPICFDSQLIAQIDYVSSEKTASSFQCKAMRHIPYNSFLAEHLPQVTQKVQKLEKLLDYLQSRTAVIHLIVIDGKPDLFRIQGANVYMSKDIFLSDGQLEKVILKTWYRENAVSPLLEFSLFEEAFTDLFLYAALGSLAIKDPFLNERVDTNANIRWPQILKSLKGYCKTPWRITEHFSLCTEVLKGQQEAAITSKVSPLSVRPLISASIIQAYKDLNGASQLEVLKLLVEVIQGGRPIVAGPSTGASEARDLVKGFHHQLSALDSQNLSWRDLVDYFTGNLQKRGYASYEVDSDLDILFFLPKNDELVMEELSRVIKGEYKISLAVKLNDLIYFPGSEDGIQQSEFKNLRALRGVLVQCELPSLPQVLAYSDKVQKLLIIKYCEDKAPPTFSSYIRTGVTGFIDANLKQSFISLHLPSLKYVFEKSRDKNLLDIYSHFRDGKKINDPALIFDERLKAYQIKSAVEAIDWLRQ